MIGGEILALLLLAAAVIAVVAPLLRDDAAEAERVSSAVSEVRDLQSRREMLLASLRDLEDDFATGKVDQADYSELRASMSSEAVEIMKQLDALDEAARKATPVGVPKPKRRRRR